MNQQIRFETFVVIEQLKPRQLWWSIETLRQQCIHRTSCTQTSAVQLGVLFKSMSVIQSMEQAFTPYSNNRTCISVAGVPSRHVRAATGYCLLLKPLIDYYSRSYNLICPVYVRVFAESSTMEIKKKEVSTPNYVRPLNSNSANYILPHLFQLSGFKCACDCFHLCALKRNDSS